MAFAPFTRSRRSPAAPRRRSRRSAWFTRRQVDEAPAVAHVLRRLTFGPHPGRLDEYLGLGAAGTIDRLLGAEPFEPERPQLGTDDDYSLLTGWWVRVMADPNAGLHEKMVWFWHGHLTSSLDKAEAKLMMRQHELFRTHALGNFRTLLQAIAVDGAMLEWLDGAWSQAEAPNENFARELMELFALGHGAYGEADVRAAAYALTGWQIDYDNDDEIVFDTETGPQEARTFLGVEVASAAEVIDVVCDQPACATWIAGRIYEYLVGQAPADDVLAELAGVFRDSGLEIRPLVEAVVRHPSFLEQRMNRHRPPVEWFSQTRNFLGIDPDHWSLDSLGQMPFLPPNVKGWPGGDRWQSAGAAFAKAQFAWDNCWDTPTTDTDDPVGELLWKAGLVEVSEETRSALQAAADSIEGSREQSSVLHSLIVCCPEFSVS